MRKFPLVVVGTPGSGTRVFARLVEATGRDMGAHQTAANDAFAFFRFANRWCKQVYPAWAEGEPIDHEAFEAELRPCLEAHLSETAPGAPWGWKQPRSLYMLPALHHAFPRMRVIHVLRDGRDVVFSSEPNVRLAGAFTVPPAAEASPDAVKAAFVWDAPNRLAADFGEARLGDRYLRLRLEDVCEAPEEIAQRIADFSGGCEIGADRVHEIVHTPESLGRWRGEDPDLVAEISEVAEAGLRRFGYATRIASNEEPSSAS
jgi:hypothetical protein